MKNFRSFVLIFALTAMIPLQIFAQKPEKTRCYEVNCVFDVLNQLRSDDTTTVNDARTAIVAMSDEAWMSGDSRMCEALKESIIPFSTKFSDNENIPLLISQLPKFCTAKDIPLIMQLTENESLADNAIRAVGEIQDSKGYIEKTLMKNHDNLSNKAAWAYAVGKQNVTMAENNLISWMKDADEPTKVEIYKALVVIRSNDKTTSIIKKGAKKLLKSKIATSRVAGLEIMSDIEGEKAMPAFYKALKDKSSEVRVTALNLMKPYVNQEVVDKVMKKCKKGDALADAIDWLGDIKNDSYMPIIIEQLSSDNPKLVEASIRAIFKIDNHDGIGAVKPMFGGEYQEVIKESMIAYEGDYVSLMRDVLHSGNARQKLGALLIAECRPTVAINENIRALVGYNDRDVRNVAFRVLRLVAVQRNADYLRELLQWCDNQYVTDVQLAIKTAMKKATDEAKDYFVVMLKHVKPEIISRFYKVYAYFGTELCIDKLITAYREGPDKEEAAIALSMVENEAYKQRIEEAMK